PGGFICSIGAVKSDKSWLATDETGASYDVHELGNESIGPWGAPAADLRPPQFRKSFELKSKPAKATVSVIGLGDYELFINGKRVGDFVMNQTWTQYDKTLFAREFDVSKLLKAGKNEILASLGNSFWIMVPPGGDRYFKGDALAQYGADQPFLFSLDLVGDGLRVQTDATWEATLEGPVTFSHVQAGEDYDARLETASSWQPVEVIEAPKVQIQKDESPGMKVFEVFKPKKWIDRNGKWSVDFGQNASAMIEFEVTGARGSEVLIRPSEVMTEEGDVQQLNLWGRSAHCVYTLKGAGVEKHRWRFWYHGFRYAEIEGAVPEGKPNPNNLPVLKSIRMLHVRADNPTTGSFECSSELYNKTHSLIDWAMRSNMVHVMSDCPHREKMGWMECSYLLAPKYLMLPGDNPFANTVEWGAAAVFVPWHLYTWYGDVEALRASYTSMKAYVDYVTSRSPDGIAYEGLGDWYDYGHGHGPGPSRFTPTDLTSTATYLMMVKTLIEAAKVLGQPDVGTYTALAHKVDHAFRAKFLDENGLVRHKGSPQAGTAMAIEAGVLPRDAVAPILDDLARRDYQQTPGDVGHLYFLRALAKAGRSDVLHRVYSRTGLGSYGGILAKGLTTLPETWDAITVGSNSLNHCMLGHVMEWYYGWVLGIRQAPGSVGWKHVLIAPEPGQLTWAKGQIKTPLGMIKVAWKRDGNALTLEKSVPKGVKVEVVVPKGFRLASGS
ncbi:MAG TPA: family 78 glycoside hydrolase catalytic domain, partial [Fimbriimonadaceae bacterium]|nr:family 78 glycoside hydrolase catalytic domain [Fimbriimonadaceae bacterium]